MNVVFLIRYWNLVIVKFREPAWGTALSRYCTIKILWSGQFRLAVLVCSSNLHSLDLLLKAIARKNDIALEKQAFPQTQAPSVFETSHLKQSLPSNAKYNSTGKRVAFWSIWPNCVRATKVIPQSREWFDEQGNAFETVRRRRIKYQTIVNATMLLPGDVDEVVVDGRRWDKVPGAKGVRADKASPITSRGWHQITFYE